MGKENIIDPSELILNNLRKNVNRVTDHVFGTYFNSEMNVYKSDEMLCDDLIDAYDELRKGNKLRDLLIFVMAFMIFVLLYMGVKHLWVF